MTSRTSFGSPLDTGGNPVILFDGVCNLCNRFVDFVIRHDSPGLYQFAALQSDASKRRLSQLPTELRNGDSIVLIEGERLYTESDAVLRIARTLGLPWCLLGVGHVIPKKGRDILYRWVASHRYQWFGRRDTCRVPTPDELARFLDEPAG